MTGSEYSRFIDLRHRGRYDRLILFIYIDQTRIKNLFPKVGRSLLRNTYFILITSLGAIPSIISTPLSEREVCDRHISLL